MANIQCGHPIGCIGTTPCDDDDQEPYCLWCEDKKRIRVLQADLANRRYQHIENTANEAVLLLPGIHELATGIPHTIYVMKGATLNIGNDAHIDTINVHHGKVGMFHPIGGIFDLPQ